MTALPSALALTTINTDAALLSADHRGNYSAIQAAVNQILACLEGGTAGQLLEALDAGDVTWQNAAAMTVALVTALPGGPADKQQTILVDSTAAPTYAWLLQYNAGDSHWHCLGGTPAFVEVATSEGTASTGYTALTTAGPSFALPAAGDYDVEIGCYSAADNSSGQQPIMSYDIGVTGAVDADGVLGMTQGAGTFSRLRRKTGLTAETLTAKYRATTANGVHFQNRWMKVLPVKL